MKILVPIKCVVDYNVNIRVKEDGSGIDISNAKMSMNPFDEIAVEEALQLRQTDHAKEVVIVSIGLEKSQEIIRKALAMGADRGIFVRYDEVCEPLAIAKILQKIVEMEAPQIVICGKQAIDDDCNQTGQMLAALLGWGQGTFAYEIKIQENHIQVTREIDGGLQTIDLELPAVITTDLRLNKPRYVMLPSIIKAKKKQIDVKTPEDYQIDMTPRLNVLKTTPPPQRKTGIKVTNVDALIEKLQNETLPL